ncbi:hypothetical protein HK405_010665, partial [Cladochytrium tenue]
MGRLYAERWAARRHVHACGHSSHESELHAAFAGLVERGVVKVLADGHGVAPAATRPQLSGLRPARVDVGAPASSKQAVRLEGESVLAAANLATPRTLPAQTGPVPLSQPKNAEEGAEQAAPEDTIQVTVKPLKGSGSTASGPVQLRVGRLDTIEALKRLVEAATGVPVAAQRLVVGGRGLVDGKTLLDFDVADGATVSLLRKPGGAAAPAPAAAAAAPAGGTRAAPPAPAAVPVPAASPSPIAAAALDPTFWKDLRGLVAARVPDQADQNT